MLLIHPRTKLRPLHSLGADCTVGIRELIRRKPATIDKSDATLVWYLQAMEVGYRGVSSKNCKGSIRNDRGAVEHAA